MSMPSEFTHQRFEARLSDGKTAGSADVFVELTERGIAIVQTGSQDPLIWPYGALTTSEPLTRHAIDALITYSYQPGATLFVPGPKFARSLAQCAPQLTASAQRWRSARPWLWATAALAVIAIAVWMAELSPARTMAMMLPDEARQTMGRQIVNAMSQGHDFCNATEGRAILDKLTTKLSNAANTKSSFNVVVIDRGLVNAFATPGENIVLTRGLIEAAKGPDEIAGVLAHEMGHGIERHPETSFIRAIGLTAAAELLTGGGGTLSTVGVTLLQFSYSRGAESQADDHALRILREANISAQGLAGFFVRISKKEGLQESDLGNLLSTHPITKERLAKALRQKGYESKPALSEADWRSLQAICGATSGGNDRGPE
jgi:Zn-dependent protease with chaperone function